MSVDRRMRPWFPYLGCKDKAMEKKKRGGELSVSVSSSYLGEEKELTVCEQLSNM
jgi:hypothetical protein